MKYSRRGFVTSTGPNFRASKVQPAIAPTPSFSSSLQKQGCKKFRDSGRRQWALVDRPAAQNAAKGKHGKYIWEASHWGKNQAENVTSFCSFGMFWVQIIRDTQECSKGRTSALHYFSNVSSPLLLHLPLPPFMLFMYTNFSIFRLYLHFVHFQH